MTDQFENISPTLTSPALDAAAVSPSDTVSLAYVSRAIYVGTGGDLSVEMLSGSTVTFKALPAGMTVPIRVRKVRSTGTTAADIVTLW